MKLGKTCAVCMALILSLAALGGCSFSGKEYGTQKVPAGVNQTVVYDGMEASRESNRFKAEITLKDVVRGEAAEDIFAAAGGYASYHEALELEENQELLVARFTFAVTDSAGDIQVELGEKDVNMFKLVSQDGETYDYFLQRNYIDGNLFVNASKGDTQTGCLFYLVDKEDEKPDIVFMPGVNDGIWFRTALTSEDKKLVDEPLLVSDWLNAGDKDTSSYGGTYNTPLPVGEYGYMHCQSPRFGEYEIELRVDEILRGDEAKEQFIRLDSDGSNQRNLREDQEYLLVKITVNVPSIDMLEDTYLDFYVGDCRVINSTTGQEYDFENSIDFMDKGVNVVMPGGSADGWFGYVIDKNDLSPVMYYLSLDDKMIYYKLDKAYDFPDDRETYVSVIPEQNPVRDASVSKGDWKNPYNMEETVALNYNPSSGRLKDIPFTGSIQVLEAYRGETAEAVLDKNYCVDYYQKTYMEPVVLKLKVEVDSSEGSDAPSFNGWNFTVLSGRGGVIGTYGIAEDFILKDGLEQVYPGGTTEGYAGFLVPRGIEYMEIAYGDIYEGADGAWINLEFSEQPPKDSVDEPFASDAAEDQDGMEDEEIDQETKSYQAVKESLYGIILYNVDVENGEVVNCIEEDTYFYSDQQDAFDQDLEQYESLVQEFRGYAGLDAELKSDSENFTISIKMKVDFRQAEPDTIVSIFDSDYSSLTNGNGNISWKKARKSLENNGYIIRQTDKN